eukprot:TRINITY_DN1387_c0_g4_i1.p2 TRINITY_DN1387_c0_g4~~TRINITY_DN1387_c0_g4_i1.p2  ORF type:complete len:282 (-),score=15.85 TRINITY_DN1387_c0_g4_i1:571-1320(-)
MSKTLFDLQVLEAVKQSNRNNSYEAWKEQVQQLENMNRVTGQKGQVPQLPHALPLELQGSNYFTTDSSLQSVLAGLQSQRLRALYKDLESCVAAQKQSVRQVQNQQENDSNKIQKNCSNESYASRHQAAEQRRRLRINDRLDTLRKLVPHKERSNTASFLSEVIEYVQYLKQKVGEQEKVNEDTDDVQVRQSPFPSQGVVCLNNSPQKDVIESHEHAQIDQDAIHLQHASQYNQVLNQNNNKRKRIFLE